MWPMQDMVDPSQYLQQFPAAFAPLKSQFDLTSLSTLYNSVDFIGISAYPSLSPNFATKDIESATQQFDLEVKEFGIDLKDLIFNKVLSTPTGSLSNAVIAVFVADYIADKFFEVSENRQSWVLPERSASCKPVSRMASAKVVTATWSDFYAGVV